MTFIELMQFLEDRLGHHQMPLNARAVQLNDLFTSCALHHELTKEIVAAIYKSNDCRKLQDCVNPEKTLMSLVPIRLKVIQSTHTDIDTFHFIENFCASTDDYFRISTAGTEQPQHAPRDDSGKRVVQFKRGIRTRRRAS